MLWTTQLLVTVSEWAGTNHNHNELGKLFLFPVYSSFLASWSVYVTLATEKDLESIAYPSSLVKSLTNCLQHACSTFMWTRMGNCGWQSHRYSIFPSVFTSVGCWDRRRSYFKLHSIASYTIVVGRKKTNLLTLRELQQRLSKTTIFGKLPYNKTETGRHILTQSIPNCEIFDILQMRKLKHRGVLQVSPGSHSQENPIRPSGAHKCNHLFVCMETR